MPLFDRVSPEFTGKLLDVTLVSGTVTGLVGCVVTVAIQRVS